MEKIFSSFFKFIINDIYSLYQQKEEMSFFDRLKLDSLFYQFLFLIRYENLDFIKDELELKLAFENGIISQNYYHKDTSNFAKLKSQFPKLNKNEPIIYSVDKNEQQESFVQLNYDGCIVIEKTILNIIPPFERFPPIGIIPLNVYLTLKQMKIGKPTPNGWYIDKDLHEKVFKEKNPQSIYLKQLGSDILVLKGEKELTKNFFDKHFFKLYGKNGEITNIDNLKYSTLTKNIRDAIAHNNIKTYYLNNGQSVHFIKIDNNVLIIDRNWFDSFLHTNKSSIKSNYSFFFIPNYNTPLLTPEEINNVIDKSSTINITLDENGSQCNAFEQYILDLLKQYKYIPNIKQPIDEYLHKQISKHYNNFTINLTPIQNKTFILKRIMSNAHLFKDIKVCDDEPGRYQSTVIMTLINTSYTHYDTIKNCNNVSCKNAGQIFASTIHSFFDFTTNKKIEHNIGFEIEKTFMLCQLTIFFRMIKNTLFDSLKPIKAMDIFDITTFEKEHNALSKQIQKLDMSNMVIIDEKTKHSHNVISFGDKLFTLRLLRNSLSHNAISYKLEKLNDMFDLQLTFKSLINKHLSITVKACDLLTILSKDFFKIKMENLQNNEKLYTFEELEKMAIQYSKD